MKIMEVTESNWLAYKNKMLELEDDVKSDMVQKGIGNLFFTTGEDIQEYAEDPRHHVFVLEDDLGNLVSQVYIIGASSHIQGDYADLPKYFTMSDGFQTYLKEDVYSSEKEYRKAKNQVYTYKLKAFRYALQKIYGSVDTKKFNNELNEALNSNTHFDERTKLRRDINRYMSKYIKKIGASELYRQFYYVESAEVDDIIADEVVASYDEFLEASKINVYGNYLQDPSLYYKANVDNTIELDTYITDPNARQAGAAKILSFVGLSKTINEFFDKSKSDELYLSITLHKDNYLSENVAHFFGFQDYIDLERRSGIDRHVYMKLLTRSTYQDYLTELSKKISYFYNYGYEEVTEEEANRFDEEKAIHNSKIVKEILNRLETEDDIEEATKAYWNGIIKGYSKSSKSKVKLLSKC